MNNKKMTAVEWLYEQMFLSPKSIIEYRNILEQAKAMDKEQKQKVETCLRHCLLMLVQTKAHREMLNLTGGDIFLDSTIEEIKELINYEL